MSGEGPAVDTSTRDADVKGDESVQQDGDKTPTLAAPPEQQDSPVKLQAEGDPITLYGEVELPSTGLLCLAGVSYSSAKMTQIVLNENHLKHHWAFNEGGLHNHLSHHILAAYSLGASADLIRAIYELQLQSQRPLPASVGEITDANFADHLGEQDAYSSYLAFFHSRVTTFGVLPTIEKYIFSTAGSDMLVRLVSGAIHPFIQLGYGIEFELPSIVVEGLAWAACHSDMAGPLFEKDFIPPFKRSNSISMAISARLNLSPAVTKPRESFIATAKRMKRNGPRETRLGLSGFTILNHILHDPELAAGKVNSFDDSSKFKSAVQNAGSRIRMWAQEWVIDESGGFEELVAKTEEIIWMACVIYAAATRPGHSPAKLDFFTMHGVTSSIFLPSFVEVLSTSHSIKLLEAHFRVLLGYFVSRGSPKLFIQETLMAADDNPLPPKVPTFAPGAIVRELIKDSKGKEKEESEAKDIHTDQTSYSSAGAATNPWPAIIASAADHPDEHLTKTIRTLYLAASLFGNSAPGLFKSALPGTEIMDGSIFIRAAGMSMNTMGWAREDQVLQKDWSRAPLGFPQAWE